MPSRWRSLHFLTPPLIVILCVLQYVSSNCEKWSLDPEQIIIRYSVLRSDVDSVLSHPCSCSGESGGGYITFGAMVLLAQRDESHLVGSRQL